jgi:hypothetical protein
LQVRLQVVPLHVATPLGSPGHGVHEAPQVAGELLSSQAPAQSWKPALQVKLQLVPLQVAVALAGALHGVHEVVPQLLTLELLAHAPLHRW